MAKKKDEHLAYGQMPLPQGQSAYTRLKVNWSGLNRRQTVDTSVLSMESNISTAEAPYLTPSQKADILRDENNSDSGLRYDNPISMFSFDDFMIVIYRDGRELKLDYLKLSKNGKQISEKHTGYVTQKDKEGNITKKAVDSSTDSIQRSMVQFNVYENAADVLDGVYVKRLLLFPDKVSMFMKIVALPINLYNEDGDIVSLPLTNDDQGNKVINFEDFYDNVSNTAKTVYNSSSEDTRKKVETTAPDVLYCYKGRYFSWNGKGYTQSGTEKNYFMMDSLDVIVKEYYNDGYALSAEKTYNDGYKKTSDRKYNDGYKKTSSQRFDDGYRPVGSGYTYDANTGGVYFVRSGTVSPYTYTAAYLNNGDSLDGLYVRAINNSYTLVNKTFYRRGTTVPYEYTPVDNLTVNDLVTGYYEKVSDTTHPYTKKVYYSREPKTTERTENDGTEYEQTVKSMQYTYSEVTDLEYGASLSGYFEKVSDDDFEPVTYYTRSEDANGNMIYTVKEDLVSGESVKQYYTYTGNYAPPEGSNKNCYWRNTFTNVCYGYVEDDEGNKGFEVALPPAFPNLKYAAVHLSRLFGVDEDRVHVSGFNDYANWNLDTVTETNESNAWSSAAQANTKANGEFTGITVYDNHVVCFKRDFMHEIYNNKNPFRLVDVYAEGSIDNRSIQEVDGKLIFVSEDEVKVYTGGNPRIIGYYLGIDKFTAAVSGSDGRNYYLYCEEKTKDKDGNTVNNKYLFVYDTFVEQWSQRTIDDGDNDSDSEVLSFAHNKNGMYMLTDKGIIYKLDTGKYNHDWSFETDMSTSLTASSSSSYPTVSVKHISKLQMLAHIQKGAHMEIYALYDGEEYSDTWKDNNKAHLLWESGTDTEKDRMIPIRLKPRMTANYGFKLHFEGNGYVRLYEMELRTTAGGELFRDS